MDGEWKVTAEKFMKVIKKVLNTKTEENLAALREVRKVTIVVTCTLACVYVFFLKICYCWFNSSRCGCITTGNGCGAK